MILRTPPDAPAAVVNGDSDSRDNSKVDVKVEDAKPRLGSKARGKRPDRFSQRSRSISSPLLPPSTLIKDSDSADDTEHDTNEEDAKPPLSSKARGKRPAFINKRAELSLSQPFHSTTQPPSLSSDEDAKPLVKAGSLSSRKHPATVNKSAGTSLSPPLPLTTRAPSSSSDEDVKPCFSREAGTLSSLSPLTHQEQSTSSRKRLRQSRPQAPRKRGRPARNDKPEVIEIHDSEEDAGADLQPRSQSIQSADLVTTPDLDIPPPLVAAFAVMSDSRRAVN